MRTIPLATTIPLALAAVLVGCARSAAGSAPDAARAPASAHAVTMTPPASATGGDAAVPDPTVSDPDTYRVVLENDAVRVLDYHDHPGATTHQHRHPDTVLIVLAPFTRRITFPDGTSKTRAFAAGDVVWIPAQIHIGQNVGTTDGHAMLIEVKPAKR